MRIRIAAAMVFSAAFLAGCNNGGPLSPVDAQANYGIPSIEGTYSISLSGITSAAGVDITNPSGLNGTSAELSSFIGSFQADGKGNITSGTLTQFAANASSVGACTVTFTGQYELKGDASGAATITVTSTPANGSPATSCTWSGPVQFLLQAGMYGESLHLAEADGKGLVTGVATKQ